MAEERPIIVVKRVKKHHDGHHGGSWKIAYADFVTAMMAFFLLMWLTSSLSKADLEGISEYFKTPMSAVLGKGDSVGNSDSVIKGGGADPTRSKGQIQKASPAENKIKDIEQIKAIQDKIELEKLKALKKRIEKAINDSPTLSQFKNQLLLDITSEGLRIQIVDDQNRPMFALSKAELHPYARDILREIGGMLNGIPNKIGLSGHTDAYQYQSGDRAYSNWELSSDRANASRRELIVGGMDGSKVIRVVGLSSAVMFDKANPTNPVNRRISVIIMTKKAEQAMIDEIHPGDNNAGGSLNIEADMGSGTVAMQSAAINNISK